MSKTRPLRIHVQDLHGHQYRQYVETLALCGFEMGRLGDPTLGPPDLILQMHPRTHLQPEVPTLASIHDERIMGHLAAGSAKAHAMTRRFRHWIVKREADATMLWRRYGVEAAVAPYFYRDLGDARPPEPDAPRDLLCAAYVNRYPSLGRGGGWDVFREVQARLGTRCAYYGDESPLGAVTDDAARFQRARFTLHLKHFGYVCNAVVRSLASGVPVVMDRSSWERGHYEGFLDRDGGVVVCDGPRAIVSFLEGTDGAGYAALTRAAWEQGARFRRPPRDLTSLVALVHRCVAAHREARLARPSDRSEGAGPRRPPAVRFGNPLDSPSRCDRSHASPRGSLHERRTRT